MLCSLTFLKSSIAIKLNTQTGRILRDSRSSVALTPPNNNLTTTPSLSARPPNITIIAIWNPKTNARPQAYLPNYFASIRANPKIHLLFVVFDKFQYGCDKPIAPIAENIKEICFDIEGYWRLHAEFLCQRWGCLPEEEEVLLQTLIRRSDGDWVSSSYLQLVACSTSYRHFLGEFLLPSFPSWHIFEMDKPRESYMVDPLCSCLEIKAHRIHLS